MEVKVQVSYKKVSMPIKAFFVFGNRFFIIIDTKLWIIDYSGKQYPDLSLRSLEVEKISFRSKFIFLITGTKDMFLCKLGGSLLEKVPIGFDLVRFGRCILFSRKYSLFELKSLNDFTFRKICSFDDEITDFVHSSKRIFILVKGRVLWTFWFPGKLLKENSFEPVSFLTHFTCKKLHINSLKIVFVENAEYLVCLLRYKPILITKPGFYYDFSLTKYYAVFLTDKVLLFSIFTGKVDKIVNLTGFSSVCDFKTDKVWIYANSLFELSIIASNDRISRFLVEQRMFKLAIKLGKNRIDLLEEYTRYLFRRQKFGKALDYVGLLGRSSYFDKRKVLKNSIRLRTFMVGFYCELSKDVNIPGHLFVRYLIKRAFFTGEYIELASRILFFKKKFVSFTRLIKKHKKKKIRLPFIEKINYETCSTEEKRAIHRYNLYFNTKNLIMQNIAATRFGEAKRDLVKAYKEKLLDKGLVESVKDLISNVRSKFLTYIFTRFLGKQCIRIMYEHQVYINLSYYIRFSPEVTEDLQFMLRIMGSLPEKVENKVLSALKKKLYSTSIFEAFLETSYFVLKQKR